MFGDFGFSYVGFIFLCCLFIPNGFYVFHQPVDKVETKENKVLLALEKAGQALCTAFAVIFSNFNIHKAGWQTVWLLASCVLMVLYLMCWARYFLGKHEIRDFFRPFLCIPMPLAVLPVTAIFFLSIYGRVSALSISAVILGIGHIGITWQNWAQTQKMLQR